MGSTVGVGAANGFAPPSNPQSWTGRLAASVWAAPGRERRESRSPFDSSLVGSVPECSGADAAAAVARARAAQPGWAGLPVRERVDVVRRFARRVLAERDALLDLIQVESGKARTSALEEVLDASLNAAYYAGVAEAALRPRRVPGAIPLLTRTTVRHVPKGVVGVISPWNYPFTLAVSDAIPALLAGNTVVLKPDENTPFAALAAVDVLHRCGLPEDAFGVVTGAGPVVGAALVDEVDYVMFTGSCATGRDIAERCGRRLIGFSAELGGKNAMIVLADADVEAAARHAVHACFSNAGQLCVSIERIYVEEPVVEEFTAAFVGEVNALRLAPGLSWDADVGSLVSAGHFEVVSRHVADAVARGARVLAGGRPRPDLGPLFFEPTVLTDVTDDMLLAREETFGPVVALQPVADADEAVARANDSRYGLNAAVWSTPRRGERVAALVEAGTVNVNEGYAGTWASYAAPQGGRKDSGLGRRHGVGGLLKYTEPVTIALQRGHPVRRPAGVTPERWAAMLVASTRVLHALHDNPAAAGVRRLRARRRG